MCGEDPTIRSVASMPFSRGICRSISTMSGCRVNAALTASIPFVAVPTTSLVLDPVNRAFRPIRNSSWSSTTRIRSLSIVLPRGLVDRDER